MEVWIMVYVMFIKFVGMRMHFEIFDYFCKNWHPGVSVCHSHMSNC